MMHAHLAETAAFNKQVNVLVDRRQRARWDSFLYARIALFRTRMAMHRLHHFVPHLPLVSHRDAVFLAKLAKRFGLVHQYERSINDKYYRLVNIVIHSEQETAGELSSTAPSCRSEDSADRAASFPQSLLPLCASRRSPALPASSTAVPACHPSGKE